MKTDRAITPNASGRSCASSSGRAGTWTATPGCGRRSAREPVMKVTMLLRCLGMMRGGGETRHMAWMRELTAMGVDVEVITGGPLFGDMRFPTTDLACRNTTVIKSPYMRDLVYKTQGRRGFGRLGVAMLHTDE